MEALLFMDDEPAPVALCIAPCPSVSAVSFLVLLLWVDLAFTPQTLSDPQKQPANQGEEMDKDESKNKSRIST